MSGLCGREGKCDKGNGIESVDLAPCVTDNFKTLFNIF